MDRDLSGYGLPQMDNVYLDVRQIDPASVQVSAWAPLKCQFGCDRFSMTYACPPHTPGPAQTQAVLDGYRRGLLFHCRIPFVSPGTRDQYVAYYRDIHSAVVELEETLFKDGYHKAFSFLFGGCVICDTCAARENLPCRDRPHLRPCMESSGMDVFETVRNNGFDINTLKVRAEDRNHFCLILVD
jgi:predicted metal-binding protein